MEAAAPAASATAMRVADLLRRLAAYRAALAAGGAAGLSDAQARDLADVVRKNRDVCAEFIGIAEQAGVADLEEPKDQERPDTDAQARAPGGHAQEHAQGVDWNAVVRALGQGMRLLSTVLETIATEPREHRAGDGPRQPLWQRQPGPHAPASRRRRPGKAHAQARSQRRGENAAEKVEDSDSDANEEDDEETQVSTSMQRMAVAGGTAVATALVGIGTYRAVRAQQEGADLEVFSETVDEVQWGDDARLNGDYSRITADSAGRLVAADADAVVQALKLDGVALDGDLAQTSQQVLRMSSEMVSTLKEIATALNALRSASFTRSLASGSLAAAGALALAQLWVWRAALSRVAQTSALSGAVCVALWGVHLAKARRARERSRRAALLARALLVRLGTMQDGMTDVRKQVVAASRAYRESQAAGQNT